MKANNLWIKDNGLGIRDNWGLRELRHKEPKKKTIEDIDNQKITEWSVKLFLLMNLTWGYVDTICNLCAQMRVVEVKKQMRDIKEWKRRYYQFRQSFYGEKDEINETFRGEWFEDVFSSDFDKLFNGIDNLTRVVSRNENHRILMIAVQQALTLIDAVKRYARHVDSEIKKEGVWVCDFCMVQTEFLKMAEIVGKLPCAKDGRFEPLRELSSKILFNRLNDMEVWEKENGQVGMRAMV